MPPRGPQYELQRAKRKRAFARAKWLARQLLLTLGGCCAECGESEPTLLTVDHPDGVTWDRYALRYDARVSRYIMEFCEGVRLRCLCLVCNGRFGQLAQMVAREPGEDSEEEPEVLDVELEDAPF